MADKEIVIKIKQEGGVAGMLKSAKGGGSGGGGIIDSILGMAGKGGGGIAKMMAGVAGGMVIAVGLLAVVAAAVQLLVGSSLFLQKTLGRIGQMVMRVIRPIADIFATLLSPLIWMLMPLVRIMSMIFRPFQQFLRQELAKRREQFQEAAMGGPARFGEITVLYFEAIGVALSKWFEVLGGGLLESAILSIVDIMEDLGLAFITFAEETVIGLLEGLRSLGNVIIDSLIAIFPFAETALLKIRGVWNDAVDVVETNVRKVFGAMKTQFEKDMEAVRVAVSNAFDFIMEKVSEMNTLIDSARTQSENIIEQTRSAYERVLAITTPGTPETKAVFDAVITPSGQVIQTDPADYIFATKNPENLIKGGGGGVTFDFSNMTIYASDAEETKRKLDELIQESMSKLA